MVNTIPPLGEDEKLELERNEFNEMLSFALANALTDIKILFFKKHPERLEEFLKEKKYEDLTEYFKVNKEDFQHLNGLYMLTLDSLPKILQSYSDEKLESVLNLILYSVFAECDEMAESSLEFQNMLGILKTRIIELVFFATRQNADTKEIVSDYVKGSLVEAYSANSMKIPSSLRIQLNANERKQADELLEIDDDLNELSETILRSAEQTIEKEYETQLRSADPRIIQKVVDEKKELINGAITSTKPILMESIQLFEEDPSVERIVREILGIK